MTDADVYNQRLLQELLLSGLVGADGNSDGEWKFGWNKNDIGWWYCTSVENKNYYTSKNGWKKIEGSGISLITGDMLCRMPGIMMKDIRFGII